MEEVRVRIILRGRRRMERNRETRGRDSMWMKSRQIISIFFLFFFFPFFFWYECWFGYVLDGVV